MRIERHGEFSAGASVGAPAGRLTCRACGHRHLSVSPRIALDLGVRCRHCGGELALERLRCADCGDLHAGVDPHAAEDADVHCPSCLGELAWRAEGRFAAAPAEAEGVPARSEDASATRAGAR